MLDSVSTLFALHMLLVKRPEDSLMQSWWRLICENANTLWTQGSETKKINCPNGKCWYLINTTDLLVRECYELELQKVLEERAKEKPLLLYLGTAGVGKSGFLQFLLLYLVYEAQTNKTVYSIRLRKFQGDNSPPADWLLYSDGRVVDCCGINKDVEVDYFLSDSQDIPDSMAITASKGCFLATSESSNAYKLYKRINGTLTRPIPLFR